MGELVLEVGKTYVFRDEESKLRWLGLFKANQRRFREDYDNGFKIGRVRGKTGSGYIGTRLIISKSETKYFKLKEENDVKEFTKDMLVAGKHICETRNGQKFMVMLDSNDNLFMSDPSVDCGFMNLCCDYDNNLDFVGCGDDEWDVVKVYTTEAGNFCYWNQLKLIWEREELTEQQKKILKLEETINKAQEQIKQLKGE